MDDWEREYVELLTPFPRLSDEWFTGKLQLAKSGDEDARVLVIGSSLWIAWETAREFVDLTNLDLPELTQEANLGLLDAMNSYLGEDVESYKAHVGAVIRDRLVKLVLCRPVLVE
ncbi:MAG: hypothetical protein WBL15_19765 [Phycisphaerae bacterium]